MSIVPLRLPSNRIANITPTHFIKTNTRVITLWLKKGKMQEHTRWTSGIAPFSTCPKIQHCCKCCQLPNPPGYCGSWHTGRTTEAVAVHAETETLPWWNRLWLRTCEDTPSSFVPPGFCLFLYLKLHLKPYQSHLLLWASLWKCHGLFWLSKIMFLLNFSPPWEMAIWKACSSGR